MPKYDQKEMSSHTTARYDSVQEAVTAATSIFNAASARDDREYGGFILHDPKVDKYYFTYTIGEEGVGHMAPYARKPKSHKAVALWHSHGKEKEGREYFSESDIAATNSMKMPHYMVDGSGGVQMLMPGEKPRKIKLGGGSSMYIKGHAGEEVMGPNGQPLRVRNQQGGRLGQLNQEQQMQAHQPARITSPISGGGS